MHENAVQKIYYLTQLVSHILTRRAFGAGLDDLSRSFPDFGPVCAVNIATHKALLKPWGTPHCTPEMLLSKYM